MDTTTNREMAYRWTKIADEAMKRRDYNLAVRIYSNAFEIEEVEGARYLLPRISACYRRLKRSGAAVSFYKKALSKFGDAIIDKVVLTAISSAYGDINDWDEALRCARLAIALNDGVIDEYLDNVLGRIHYNLQLN